jgi:hypothetical protein
MFIIIMTSALVLVTGALVACIRHVKVAADVINRQTTLVKALDAENTQLMQQLYNAGTQVRAAITAIHTMVQTGQLKCEQCYKTLTLNDAVIECLDGYPHTWCGEHSPPDRDDPIPTGWVEGVIDMKDLFGPETERIKPDDNRE